MFLSSYKISIYIHVNIFVFEPSLLQVTVAVLYCAPVSRAQYRVPVLPLCIENIGKRFFSCVPGPAQGAPPVPGLDLAPGPLPGE